MNVPKCGVWYYKEVGSPEIRYSIRSAVTNLGLEKVIIVGDKPKWFAETENSFFLSSKLEREASFTDAWIPWQHMAHFSDSNIYHGEFLLFNDDFYVLKPINEWIDYYRNRADYDAKCGLHNKVYHRRELRAFATLGIPESLGKHYNLHMPMRMNTHDLREAVRQWRYSFVSKDVEFRTTYGNLFPRPDEPHNDVKYANDGTWYSSGERYFPQHDLWLKAMFPDKVFCEK